MVHVKTALMTSVKDEREKRALRTSVKNKKQNSRDGAGLALGELRFYLLE